MASESDVAERHLQACQRFGYAMAEAGEKWDLPSPCTEWNAGVLDHVIGFTMSSFCDRWAPSRNGRGTIHCSVGS